MSDAEKAVWVLCNGEIYNFRELRLELEACGHEFRTNSDTEVIVHGYKQWGKGVLNRLNGMFGLAIWDGRNRRLILARDRMGIKVVYHAVDGERLLFGSEIRPILAALGGKPVIDPCAIALFLRYRYTPSPLTIFQGIRKLAAGTCLIVDEGQMPRLERWWDPTPVPFDPMPSDGEAEETLLAIYSSAVKRQLISDVPVGLLLSGGMDSALLLGLMCQGGRAWNTYTVGFGQCFSDDELQDAACTARALGCPNTQIKLDRRTFEDGIAKVASALEEPVATASVVPMYYLCQQARRDVKVALVGQGPDELFGGYVRHLGVGYGRYWRALPGAGRSALKAMLCRLPRTESLKRALYSLDEPERLIRYQQVFSILPHAELHNLFHDGILDNATRTVPEHWRQLAPAMCHLDELGGLQFLEVRSSLPDELLVYADKLSMAHGLELRVPYLDQEIVDYVERLSATFKIRYGVRKWLHRRVAKRLIPHQVLSRKKKGFASNIVDDWFRDSLAEGMNHTLSDPGSLIYRYLRFAPVRGLLEEHRARRTDNHKILFSLVMLEHLLRAYDALCWTDKRSAWGAANAEKLGASRRP
jgi:asparagine synthase (glutamine-hydrolysing)